MPGPSGLPGLPDLPDLEAASRERRRREIRHGFMRHAGVCLGGSAVLGGINRAWSLDLRWALVLALVWGAALAAHGLWAWRRLRRI